MLTQLLKLHFGIRWGNVPLHLVERYEREAKKHWDIFYKRLIVFRLIHILLVLCSNKTNFYKDRHYIQREFLELREAATQTDKTFSVCGLGCGVGNTLYPILEESPNFILLGVDFSPRAVEFAKQHELYDASRCAFGVCDLTADDPETNVFRSLFPSLSPTGASIPSSSGHHEPSSSIRSSKAGSTENPSIQNVETNSDRAQGSPKSSLSSYLPWDFGFLWDLFHLNLWTSPAAANSNSISTSASSIPEPDLDNSASTHSDVSASKSSLEAASEDHSKSLAPPLANQFPCDFGFLMFVLSAISPAKVSRAIEAAAAAVKPGGYLYFRDYAVGDLAQERFESNRRSKLGKNFYVRNEKTRAYFFEKSEVLELFTGSADDPTCTAEECSTAAENSQGGAKSEAEVDESDEPLVNDEGTEMKSCDVSQRSSDVGVASVESISIADSPGNEADRSRKPLFEVVRIEYFQREIENRKQKQVMKRKWLQAIFRRI